MSRVLSFLSSMRFAISLLAVVGIASAIGTIIKQNEPHTNYLNQFGPFWFDIFQTLGYFTIYSSLPFLLILSFLVLSTSLCVWRQTPTIWRDFHQRRAHGQWQAMKALPHHAMLVNPATIPTATELQKILAPMGGRLAIRQEANGVLATIRHGRWQRLGYVFTHVAIVVICLGGLMDGQFPLRVQTMLGQYQPIPFTQTLSSLPSSSLLPADNRSFRANLFVPEGDSRDLAMVVVDNGRLWQKLPFSVTLEKFIIDHYTNGMPKNFESHIVINRNASTPANSSIPATGIRQPLFVNHPFKIDGYTIYQAGFDDGGSEVALMGYSLSESISVPSLTARLGDTATFANNQEKYLLELTQFAPINVEARPRFTDEAEEPSGFAHLFTNATGTAGRSIDNGKMRNFGPKLTYKLRQETGEAVEVQTYLLPVQLDEGQWFWLSGIRTNATEGFRYLRIPVYDGDSVERWMEIRQLMQNPSTRAKLIDQFLKANMNGAEAELLRASLNSAIAQFMREGLGFIDQLVDGTTPSAQPSSLSEAQRTKVAETLVSLIRGVIVEAWAEARKVSGAPTPLQNADSANYVQEVMMSIHSAVHYPVPLFFQLRSFDERKATVLQVAKAPGQGLVYAGCLSLVLGIFLMIFLQDRRIMVWLSANAQTPSILGAVVRRGPKISDEQFNPLAAQVQQLLQT